MSEYIKKSAVLNKEFEAEINTYDGEYESSVAYVVLASDIYRMPAEDVAPVRHGFWEPRKDAFGFVRCSVCHECNIYNDWPDGKKWNYCPHCGAKLDLEET